MKFPTSWLVLLIAYKMDTATSKSLPDVNSIDLSQYGTRLFGLPSKAVGLEVANWKTDQNRGNPENVLVVQPQLWPNGHIPFEIVGGFDAEERTLIEDAMIRYQKQTCIKFQKRKSLLTETIYRLTIPLRVVGLSLGVWGADSGCLTTVGTVIHELMHACGLTHEQNSEERDDSVEIIKGNIKTGCESNFEKLAPGTTSGFGSAYDYGSVVHYSDLASSVNGEPTILNKRQYSCKMCQREGFSKRDIDKINKMYNCKATTSPSGYKPAISITQSIVGGIEDILSMIIPEG